MKRLPFIVLLLAMTAAYAGQALAVRQSGKVDHKEYAEMKLSECNDCHKSEGVAPNHEPDWVRKHRSLASSAAHNCAQCHTQDYCLDCHQGGGINADLTVENFRRDYVPRSHRTDFLNLHPIKALDNPQTCYRCHDKQYCNSCHDRFPRGSMRIKSHLPQGSTLSGTRQIYTGTWTNEHATEARRNLQSCQSCHPEGDVCLPCHSAKRNLADPNSLNSIRFNPHPKNFKGGNIRARSDKTCKICH